MHFVQTVDGLELENDFVLDEEIEAVFTDFLARVMDQELALDFHSQVIPAQLDDQGTPVNVFHETRSECLMDLDDTPDDPVRERIVLI